MIDMHPAWPKQFLKTDFYNDYPTDRESGPGPLAKRWYAQSRNWMKKFLAEKFSVKESDIIWSRGHFEWTMFAKIGEQWWYFSTGDIRFKTMKTMLVRKAKHPKDYTGGQNQFVRYCSSFFGVELEDLLRTGVSHVAPWEV